MNKRKFNKIKEENPESRIWQRNWSYEKARNSLAKALKKWRNNSEKYKESEKYARMDYLLEKTFSNEPLNKTDYEFIITLPKKDLEDFVDAIRDMLFKYKDAILWVSEVKEDVPFDSDVDAFVAWNKLLEYISSKRDDVEAKKISIHTSHTHVEV